LEIQQSTSTEQPTTKKKRTCKCMSV